MRSKKKIEKSKKDKKIDTKLKIVKNQKVMKN